MQICCPGHKPRLQHTWSKMSIVWLTTVRTFVQFLLSSILTSAPYLLTREYKDEIASRASLSLPGCSGLALLEPSTCLIWLQMCWQAWEAEALYSRLKNQLEIFWSQQKHNSSKPVSLGITWATWIPQFHTPARWRLSNDTGPRNGEKSTLF